MSTREHLPFGNHLNLVSASRKEALTKKQGDFVKSQEVIARSGSSGELSTGPHLHFELWSDGNPIDPTTFINF